MIIGARWSALVTNTSVWQHMIIAENKITDAAKFDEYRTKVGPMIAKHGGRYLIKGGSHKILEKGHWQPDRVVIIEFPDMAALRVD